jgi:arylsulfatase A-like enzyme
MDDIMVTEDVERPNVLLVIADEHRADALSINGNAYVQTPYLDGIFAEGIAFDRAYSACPVCIPARRTMMTGTRPRTHGVFMNHNTDLDLPTMPEAFSRAGYQTHLCGKLHLWPTRKLFGFHSSDWADRPTNADTSRIGDDYQRYLIENGIHSPDAGKMDGAHQNGWVARPFALPEQYHLTNWTVDRALRFLERRDPTVPFFLNLSVFAPHAPCCPPRYYFDKYMAMDLPEPLVGDWARISDGPRLGLPVDAWRAPLPKRMMKEYIAGYYGSIEHLDHQIGRVLQHLPKNTVVLYVSDHGEMLGQHQWIRKRSAFEGSARVPLAIRFPRGWPLAQARRRRDLVELMDIMPTLLDACGIAIPETVEGRSVMPLLRGENRSWRTYLHGECSRLETLNSGMQYLTDDRWKYIYYPGDGHEQLFDLATDPDEMHDLASDSGHAGEIARFRALLVDELRDRPEGFVRDGTLRPIGGPSPNVLTARPRRSPEASAVDEVPALY